LAIIPGAAQRLRLPKLLFVARIRSTRALDEWHRTANVRLFYFFPIILGGNSNSVLMDIDIDRAQKFPVHIERGIRGDLLRVALNK
jgi:hypothetical protein